MTQSSMFTALIALGVVSLRAAVGGAQAPPVITEWSTESRTSFSLRANEAAVQRMLPPGWTAAPSTAEANRGANLSLTVMERHLVLDGAGRVLRTGTSRYCVLSIAARDANNVPATFIVSGISPEGEGAYGVYSTATVSRVERTSTMTGEEGGTVHERWQFASATGERVDVELEFVRGRLAKSHAQSKLRSGRRPEFGRTYTIDQASEVLRSAGGVDHIRSLSLKAGGGVLSALFDGREQVLSVTSIPWYQREITVP